MVLSHWFVVEVRRPRLTSPSPSLSDTRDELVKMKPLCQPFSSTSSCSAPSSPSHLLSVSARSGVAYPSSALAQSPAHKSQGGGVKKVTGVGGTTYEISV